MQRCSSDSERVRGLLSRWREKVYELLVRRKLQEIEDIEYKEDARQKVRFTQGYIILAPDKTAPTSTILRTQQLLRPSAYAFFTRRTPLLN